MRTEFTVTQPRPSRRLRQEGYGATRARGSMSQFNGVRRNSPVSDAGGRLTRRRGEVHLTRD